eukprot:scaffold2718_cov103-Isochrysis_galbana.AAC.16
MGRTHTPGRHLRKSPHWCTARLGASASAGHPRAPGRRENCREARSDGARTAMKPALPARGAMGARAAPMPAPSDVAVTPAAVRNASTTRSRMLAPPPSPPSARCNAPDAAGGPTIGRRAPSPCPLPVPPVPPTGITPHIAIRPAAPYYASIDLTGRVDSSSKKPLSGSGRGGQLAEAAHGLASTCRHNCVGAHETCRCVNYVPHEDCMARGCWQCVCVSGATVRATARSS